MGLFGRRGDLRKQFESWVGDHPDVRSESYILDLRNLVMQLSLEQVKRELVPLIDEQGASDGVKFAAYYAAYTYYRRLEYRSDYRDLIAIHWPKFKDNPLSDVMFSQCCYAKFLDDEDYGLLDLAIKKAADAKDGIPDNFGVLQNYAVLVAEAAERNSGRYESLLEDALESIDTAIARKPYPKCYCTKGRLLACKGFYEDARRNVNRAIDLESTEGKDALLRLAKYHTCLVEIKARESLAKMNESIGQAERSLVQFELYLKDLGSEASQRISQLQQTISDDADRREAAMMDRLDKMQSRYIELLVFFSSVLAIIIAAANLAASSEFTFSQTCGFVLVVGSVLLLAYCALRLVVFEKKDRISLLPTIVAIISFVVVAVLGFYVGGGFA